MIRSLVCTLLAVFLVLFVADARLKHKHYGAEKYLNTETKRQTLSCASNEFACPEKCIPQTYVCDTENDCTGGFDEQQNCPTDCSGNHTFKCPDNRCLAVFYKCDASNDCPDGSDEKDCGGSCRGADFKCSNGACISHSWLCDGDEDCGDHSDEANCGGTCRPGYFHCTNGHCITDSWVCDGDNDCGDMGDEQNCAARTCDSSQFTCTNHKCIPAGYQCDNDNDCGDHSDEQGCTCAPDHFQCPQGKCIPNSYRCDGDNDCGDLSDESNCPTIHPGVCIDMLTYEDCYRMNTSTYPICQYYVDAHRYCRKFCDVCNTYMQILSPILALVDDTKAEKTRTETMLRLLTVGLLIALSAAVRREAAKRDSSPWGEALFRDGRASCGTELFACHEKCIEKAFVCDTIDDCTGGFDEQNCPSDCSGPNQYKCANGHCIPQNYRCDTQDDCTDNSDEQNCGGTCAPGYQKCESGYCVVDSWVCDGTDDCGDGSDERTCTGLSCNVFQFSCANGKCVPKNYKCDWENDCGDNSDEQGCTCDSNHFQCTKGGCLPAEYRCDSENDCGDMSDEANCPAIHPGVCIDLMTFEDCLRMNSTTFPICLTFADGHKYCRKYCGLCNA
ncbi:sortilin-related receptor-like [Physella acuta]|uniref:sortilin-related receptor-like n=1 Tax=Physella acuta TaxID=109671 RepID=UPI0027DBAC13|nr:sortilin-related receptor-like [Physella acuta]